MKIIKNLIGISVLFAISLPFLNQQLKGEVDLSGFFDVYNAVGINSDAGLLSSRVELKGNMTFPLKNNWLFVSAKLVNYNVNRDSFDLQVKEAYLSVPLGEKMEIRLGRQIFSWGNSERIKISDIVSPLDYSEFITMDYNEMKMGVDALQCTFFHNDLKLDVIWVPFFRGSRMPSENNPWLNEISDENLGYLSDRRPEMTLKNTQLYGKLSFFMKGFDISLFGFSKWNDIRYPLLTENNGYEKLNGFGLYFSKPVDFLVIRGEFTLYRNRWELSADSGGKLLRKDHKEWLLGTDIFLRNDLKVTLQLLFNYIPGNIDIPKGEKSSLGNINVSGKMLGNSLRFKTFLYMFLDRKGLDNRTELVFALDDSFQPSLGMDIFKGNNSFFGRYLNYSQIWLKLKYIF